MRTRGTFAPTTEAEAAERYERLGPVAQTVVRETAKDRTFEQLVDSVVEGRLSSAIYGEAKDIYPLRRVEIQKTTLEARPEEVAAEEETAVDVDEEDVDVEA